MKNSPDTLHDSMVLLDNSSVSTPPAVTSAFSYPSVPTGVRLHACTDFSNFARPTLLSASGGLRSTQRSANLFGKMPWNASYTAERFRAAALRIPAVSRRSGAKSSEMGLPGLQ